MTRFERQGAILRLVAEQSLSTQAEVAEALRHQGFEVVQTTVSRDIAQLGLVKVRAADGRLVYALPGAADLDRLEQLATAIRRWALSLEPAGTLVVIRTPPGHAMPLARAIDEAPLPDAAGTIAGDDTVFVAVRDGATAAGLVAELGHHAEGEGEEP